MKNKILHILLLFVSTASFGQASTELPQVIAANMVLPKGNYILSNNVLVPKNTTLTVESGAKISFAANAFIKVEGAILLKGKENNFIELTCLNTDSQGGGIIVSGQEQVDIEMTYVKFSKLVKPLDFSREWYRTNVNILSCEFTNINANQPGILIRVPDNLGYKETINFNFNQNRFFDNTAGIFFEDVNHPILKLSIQDNYIADNKGYGVAPEGLITSPFFIISNDNSSQIKADIKNNIFTDNYLIDPEYDTIVSTLNFGVGGIAQKVAVPNNYFGGKNTAEKLKGIDHFNNNSNQPLIDIEPSLTVMPKNKPAFVRSVFFNDHKVEDKEQFIIIDKLQEDNQLRVVFTDGVNIVNSKPIIEYVVFDDSTKEQTSIVLDNELMWLDDQTVEIKPKSKLKRGAAAFFKLMGFKDKRGFNVPSYVLGNNAYNKHIAINHPKELVNIKAGGLAKGNNEGQINLAPITLAQTQDIEERLKILAEQVGELKKAESQRNAFEFKEITRTWELGAFIGQSIYFGDLTGNDVVDFNDSYFAYGLRLGYNVSPRFTLRANLLKGSLHGNDLDNLRGTEYQRGFKFESKLYEANFQVELNINKLGYRKGSRFTPSISAGIGAFYFNPQREYNGTMYNLQDLGTNGQYVRSDIDPYSLFQVTIPFGIHLKKVVQDKFSVDLFAEWHYTFTDYLDDVGGERFATKDEIYGATHLSDLEKEAAWYFNSPSFEGNQSANRGNSKVNDWYVIIGLSVSGIL